ncbi:MAG: hypothetical protein DWQ07_21670 [Chloroflexi bacterium]|nr:MAG: hypothetical protein DWQ07_21670 [Chloroflexota bacterium]MBL1196568.1 hypothetical protein [Chloroflexota bacterium]NOH13863.1 hypothetical protein [Chloroflexota bacterium]
MLLYPFLWYLVITLFGLLAFPLAYRMLPALPGRGYAFSRALGLLVWGFSFWLLSYFGMLRNDAGGLLFAFLILLGLGVWAARAEGVKQIRNWLRANRSYVIAVEVLFLLAFAAWVFVRSANPEIVGTEKPMELAFINAVMNSSTMPPFDPWLSGFAISYYYYGYVLIGILANLTATPIGVAFNLGVSLVFALIAIGAYGLVYDLLAVRSPKARGANIWFALLAPLFVLFVSNAQGFMALLHGREFLWSTDAAGQQVSPFWTWLDIEDLRDPPRGVPLDTWASSFNWWRASRVITDYTFAGVETELIDEFPFFSFLLADLHPHVLAMPFAFVGMILALNLFLGGAEGSLHVWRYNFNLKPVAFVLAAWVFGGLAFLNIWDFPTAVALFAAAYVLREAQTKGWSWDRLQDFIVLGLLLGVTGVLIYLPYYIGFSSQAGGILPNLTSPSRGVHLWVFWGPLWLPLLAFLAYLWRKDNAQGRLRRGLLVGVGIVLGLWLLSLLLTLFIAVALPLLENVNPELQGISQTLLAAIGAPDVNALLVESVRRRFSAASGWLTLMLVLGLIVGLLWPRSKESESPQSDQGNPAISFSLLLMLFGALLVTGPEFLYLRDFFGTRMNTVFKFYIQAWLVFGTMAAFGTAILLQSLRGVLVWVYRVGLVAVLAIGLVYPVVSLNTKTNGLHLGQEYTYVLDGTQQGAYISLTDLDAAVWLRDAPRGVVVESVGGSYSSHGRIATHSGNPTLLGWDFHQIQWGRDGGIVNTRRSDVQLLYSTPNWDEALRILIQYDIRYVYLGPLERSTYAVHEAKFQQNLTPVFQQDQVTIYEFLVNE